MDVEHFYKVLGECKYSDIATSPKISTITVCANIDSKISLDKINEVVKTSDNIQIKYNKKRTKKTDENYTKSNGTFHNSLNMKFKFKDSTGTDNNISTKIFKNGALLMTGSRTIECANEACDLVYNFLKDLSKKVPDVFENNNFIMTDVRPAMINGNFSFNKKIKQESLKENINKYLHSDNKENIWGIALFQPDQYPGLKIKYLTDKKRLVGKLRKKKDGIISINVFAGGKSSIRGAKSIDEIKESYIELVKFVEENT